MQADFCRLPGERKVLTTCAETAYAEPSCLRLQVISGLFPSQEGTVSRSAFSMSSEQKHRDQSSHVRTAQVQESRGNLAHGIDTPVEKTAEFAKKVHAVSVIRLVAVNYGHCRNKVPDGSPSLQRRELHGEL